MKICIGADHRGYALKSYLQQQIAEHTFVDVGTDSPQRTDYPPFAQKVCRTLLNGDVERGILICGSGIGMVIAANRFACVYAALCWNEQSARVAREDDGSTVLVLPSDFMSDDQALACVRVWLEAKFKEGRYQKRLDMIDASSEEMV